MESAPLLDTVVVTVVTYSPLPVLCSLQVKINTLTKLTIQCTTIYYCHVAQARAVSIRRCIGWNSVGALSRTARHRSGTGSGVRLYTTTAHVTTGAATSGRKAIAILGRRVGVGEFRRDCRLQRQRACLRVICARWADDVVGTGRRVD